MCLYRELGETQVEQQAEREEGQKEQRQQQQQRLWPIKYAEFVPFLVTPLT